MALTFKSSFESFFSAAVLRAESMSVKHTKAVACPDCFWVHQPCLCEPATCPSHMRFLSKRYIYLKANHRFYFNMCMVGSWEEELQLVAARDSEQKLREALSSPSLQTETLGRGSCRSSHHDHEAQSPLSHVSLWLCLGLCLLWALASALAAHFPEFWCLYFPLNPWQPLSNTSKWNFPLEHIINLVPSAKASCHSSNINVIEPWILPLYFYRIVMVWHFQSCPGSTV